MKHVWTWGGKYFGYFDGDDLRTHAGRHVGKRNGDDIYSPGGKYLGEVMNSDRLIVNRAKKNWVGPGFTPTGPRGGIVPFTNYTGYTMYAGHEDFPAPSAV